MKALFDTSSLVAAMVARHPEHESCRRWLARVARGEVELVVAAHTIAELYAVLSTLPTRPRLGPDRAWRLIEDNVLAHARIVALSASDQAETVHEIASQGLSGGIVYDGLIARVARSEQVDVLLTLNERHFRRVWPEGPITGR